MNEQPAFATRRGVKGSHHHNALSHSLSLCPATNRRFRGLRFCAYALATIGILSWSFHGAATAEEPRTKNVLVLFSSVEYSQSFLNVIEPSIRARVAEPINFYDAYLEDPQVEQKVYRESQAEAFSPKVRGREARPRDRK